MVCCAVAFGSFGCTGQNLEGSWLGPLPFEDAKACRIKIYSDHRFDVACGSLDWAGAGRYERDGSALTFRFAVWVHRGEPQANRPSLRLRFRGEGNTLRLWDVTDEQALYVWRRQRL